MIFDELCTAAERGIPVLLPALRAARLFVIPDDIDEQVRRTRLHNYPCELFALPYPCVAIEQGDFCSMLIDAGEMGIDGDTMTINVIGEPQPKVSGHGIEITRIVPRDVPRVGLEHGRWYIEMSRSDEIPGLYAITVAPVIFETPRSDRVNGVLPAASFHVWMDNRLGSLTIPNEPDEELIEDFDRLRRQALGNALHAVKQVAMIQLGEHVVIERTSAIPARKPKPGHLARSHQRPQYTPLPIGKARELMKLPSMPSGRRLTIGHERRGHVRWLRAARYVNKRDCAVVVRPAWIGPREAVVGPHRYRVVSAVRQTKGPVA